MRIVNLSVFGPDGTFQEGALGVDGPLLCAPDRAPGPQIDGRGLLAIPGLIDVHLHGAVGCDIMDGRDESLHAIARYLAASGVTTFFGATMTEPLPKIEAALTAAAAFTPGPDEADLAGIYLEGPYIAPDRCGAQDPRYARRPEAAEFRRLQELARGRIRAVVLAPELDGAAAFISALGAETVLTIGHTTADHATADAALRAGARCATHLYNAMPPLLSRAPGVIGAIFDQGAYAEIIADAVHVHPCAVRLASTVLRDHLILISDAMQATGLQNGEYTLGGQAVTVHDGEARLHDGTLAGSVHNLWEMVHCAVHRIGLSPEQAVRAATQSPAALYGLEAGQLRAGARADVVFMSPELAVQGVMVRGRLLDSGFLA